MMKGHFAVVGSVALDEVYRVDGSLEVGSHGHARPAGTRLGGGAGCVAMALAQAGHRVSLVAALGEDDAGARLLEELAGAGVDTSPVRRLRGASTRSLVLVDSRGERTILNLHRCAEEQPPRRLLELGAELVYVRSRGCDLAPLLEAASRSARVVAHVPPCDPGARPAHVLVGSASDLSPSWIEQSLRSGRAVAGDRLLEWVVVTRGAGGATATSESTTLEAAAPRVTAVDTTGAGDAFAAGLLDALGRGLDMPQALRVAVAWGSESTLWQSSTLTPQAIERLRAL